MVLKKFYVSDKVTLIVMLFVLSKILSFLISPFNTAVIMVLCAILLPRFRKKLFIIAFTVFIVFSNPFLFRLAIGWWEDIPEALPRNSSEFKFVVVLGGISSQHESSQRVRFSQSSDRLMQALILSKQNRVEKLVISGGNASIIYHKRPEGAYLKEFLVAMDFDDEKILIDSLSRNTYENALFTRQLFQEAGLPLDIVLVTSAWHMPRAQRCFEKQGFTVRPLNSDFIRPIGKLTPGEIIIPSAGTLLAWDIIFKEWMGLLYYKVRGYI